MMFAKLHRRQRILSAICALLLAFLTLSSATAQAANSQPAFPSSENGARSVAENTAAGANIGAPVGATDADNDALTYTLGGDDAASFAIVPSTGQLQTLAALNFEGKNSYSVTVSASDRKDATGNADTAIDVTIDVTISVTNVDDPGAITLSSQAPVVGIDLTASITDPDGGVSSIGWTWSKSSDQTTWTAIAGATSSTYRPVAADVGSYLRATAAYTDSQGPGKNAQQKTDAPVVRGPIEVRVTETTLRFAEGHSVYYYVSLNTQPSSKVVIAVSSNNTDVTASPATLTFSPSNWDTAQTVTVRAAQDADAVNDAASITHAVDASRSADEYDGVAVGGVSVSVADDDAGVSVSVTELALAEGGQAAYTVVLDALPASDVVITVSSDNSDVTADRATLTFSPSNWDTAQTVTVSAAQDADAVNDAASITHAVDASRSADEYDAVAVGGVSVTVADDETAGVSVSASALELDEGGQTAYTVVLDALPSGNVVIGVTASGSPDVTVDRATLTFSPSNWDTAQTVTVSTAQDADAANDAASITHAVDASRSAYEYDGVPNYVLPVSVADDDAGVSVSVTELALAEGGQAAYTVVLDALPASDVVITVSSDNSDVTVDRATLTFSPSNWDTAQTVTVSAAQDADAANDAASITHAVDASRSADEYDAVAVGGVSVSVAADETAGVSVSVTELAVAEGGQAAYTVVLDALPSGNVVIGVTISGSPDVTVDRATLTFSPSNWDTAQTVTVSAAQDADAVNDAASITHAVDASRSADEYDGVAVGGVSVSVADDDAGVSVSVTELALAEGGQAAYTVVLDALPASDVVITVSSDNSDVTADRATLTFSPSNWDTAQTVTVSAAQDADAVNDAASITHAVDASRSADEYDAVAVGGVSVTVADDETAGVSVSASALSVAAGGQAAYTVVLDALPSGNVVIGVTASGSPDVTVDRATLTFSPSNWDTAQTVTVSAAQDADAVNDAASITHAVDASRSANEYDGVPNYVLPVTVVDDDTAGVTVSKSTLPLDEGTSAAYTVVLDALPVSDVVIGITISGSPDVTVDRATLTFSPSNWDTAQTVTVSAAQDADAVNDVASITHAVVDGESADEYDGVAVAGVRVSVADDPFGVTVSATDVTVAEGGSSTYTVWLDRQPSHNTVVRVTASGNGGVSVSPVRLIFTSATWDTPQTVTVSAAEDADAADAAASIAHAVVPLPYNRIIEDADADVSVTVIDDDALGMSLSETVVKVNEGGSSTYTVWLDTLPSGGVVIGVTASGSPDVSVSPARLTFTTANWDTAQTVTVRAAQDADAVNDAAFITHAVVDADSADEYDAVAVAGVSVSVADDDAGVSVSASALSVAEGGSATYTVVLNAQPASDVMIAVSSDNMEVSVSPARLTFTPSNWDTAQTVTVSAAQDADAVNDAASITHAVDASRSADEYDAVAVAGVSVSVADDDAGVSVSASALSVAEGGSATYTVVLNAQPASDVVIAVSSDNMEVSVSPARLTFTTSNWSAAQTVTVRADQDADAVNDAASITHAVVVADSADEYDAVTEAVTVTVVDDQASGLRISAGTVTVAEGGQAAYTVVMDAEPASDVVIAVSSDNMEVSVSPARLTFTPSNWDTAQTVTVSAAQDADAVNDAASIAHAVVDGESADEYDGVAVAGVSVTVADDDAGVSVSASALSVAEGGSATYTVVLNAQPASDVVIAVSSDNMEVSVSPARLTFTTSNWSAAQTVTVRADQDADAVNDAASITHAVVVADSADEYDAVTEAVTVTVVDDQASGLRISAGTVTVAEGGQAAYTVVMDAEPASDVVIAVSSDNMEVSVSPARLTFTTSNWSATQTVTVRAAQDADAVNDAASITHAVVDADSADEYDGVAVAGVSVSVADDDAGVSVSASALSVAEGGSATYTVVLNAQPASDVVIAVSSDNMEVSVSPARLTFTPSNWDTAQTVTVSAAQDADAVNDAASITHAVVAADSADEYDAVTINGVAVTVTDNDASVTVSALTPLPVAEGGQAAYTVVMDAEPASDVVITASSDNSDVTVDTDRKTDGNQSTLTFTPSNWDTAQRVTVRTAEDADMVDDIAAIAHAVVDADSADEYDGVAIARVDVRVSDDDGNPGPWPSELAMYEGDNITLYYKLPSRPSSNVLISLAVDDSSDVAVSPEQLTFTPANWDTAQRVEVQALQDDDAADGTATLTRAVVSADKFDHVAPFMMTVTVTDDETVGVSVLASTLSVNEGGSATYTVVLDTMPSGNVQIGAASNNSDVRVSSGGLTFTPSNWNMPQTVTVRAAQDADAVNDAASITHAVVDADSVDEYDGVAVAGVDVTVTDDDTAGLTVNYSPTINTVRNTLTVVLDAEPTSRVVVRVTTNKSGDVTVDTDGNTAGYQDTLTFTPDNWNKPEEVILWDSRDIDAFINTSFTVVDNQSADEYEGVSITRVLSLKLGQIDYSAPALSTLDTISIRNGESESYKVVLRRKPTSNVVVSITFSEQTEFLLSSTSLTFTPNNWNTPQTVTLSVGGNKGISFSWVSLTHSVVADESADEYDNAPDQIWYLSTWDTSASLVVTAANPMIIEEGGSATYTVALRTRPSSNVVVIAHVWHSDVTVDTDATRPGKQNRLTFTSSNWSTAQTVTAWAAQDDDSKDERAYIRMSVVSVESAVEFHYALPGYVYWILTDDEPGVSVSVTELALAEGGSAAYTVVLEERPTHDVVIGVTASGSPDVTVDRATLTFTSSNWSTAQTVTVRAAQDADAVNDAASISHAVDASRSANEYVNLDIDGVRVTVDDDETVGISVSETALPVAEGGSATYTVVLDASPPGDWGFVRIALSSDNPDVTVDRATLRFNRSNWDTAQTVTVRAAQDADAVNDAASITHKALPVAGTDYYHYRALDVALPVTVDDDDDAGVSVSVTELAVAEGGSAAYTVVLDALPSGNVVIGVTASGSPDVTVDRATLRFNRSNWDTAQTVTVRAAQDADAANDAASITHAVDASRSANEYGNLDIDGVRVTVDDDETVGISVSETALPVAEGGSATYTVVLDASPPGDWGFVRIALSSDNPDVTVDRDTLRFNRSNWDTAQTVTVRAAQDADAVNDAASITHKALPVAGTDYYHYRALDVALPVTVADDETAGVSVSVTELAVAEGGSAAYTVVLDALPASDVVIGVTASGSPDVTVDRATLTFSPSNWDTAQTVTVRAAQDADAVNDAASITHAVDASRSADEYDGVAVGGVSVSVADDDAGVSMSVADDDAGVSVSVTELALAEGGQAAYTVVLDALPASDVVITVSSDNSDVTADRATLTFSPSNWDTAQTVTVSAAQDADAVNDAASITHAVDASRSADEYDAVSVAGVAVTVADDDTAGVSVSETTLTVAEGNSSTYTVVLDAQPASDVVITVSSDNSDVTADTDAATSGNQTTLTFTSSNWDTAQTVTVRAAQDADAVNDAASITHAVDASRSADEYDAVSVAGVAVTVADDDAGVSVSETTLTVAEGNSSTYTVVLDAQPASDVVIGVTASGSPDVTVDRATLRFNRSNWDTAQTVTVRAAQDADAANDAASITHAVDASRSANEYGNLDIDGVRVTVDDDETVGISVSETALPVAEGGSATYTVVLDASPPGDWGFVRIALSSDNPDVTVDRATLRFNRSNWDTAQTVTVRAAQDADAVNDAASITHKALPVAGTDYYHYRALDVALPVTVADDETAGVSVSVTELALAEGGQAAYTVVLDALPASDVVITVSSDNSDVTADRATLTFSPSNWDTAQTVTVSAAQDADAVNDAASITHAVDASRSADEYDAVSVAGVAVTVADDDTAGVSVSETTLTVAEGNSSTYTVVLDAQPASDVVITVSSDNSDVTADTDAATSGNQTTLTFTSSNWDTAQTVTVRAAQDADAVNDAASITHAVDASRSADEYDAVSVAGVAVTVADDDTAGVSVSETTLTVAEGNSSTYTVVLDAQPASDVVITVSSDNSDVTADTDAATSGNQTTLTFTSSNWDTAQTVTVRAAQDADAVNDAASITHAVDASRSADEYDAVSVAGVAVTVADDDTAGVSVSETTLTVAEGNSSTYTVVLDAQPASDVVIGVTISGSPDVTVDRATLTFSPSNWDTAQTVTVRAAQDADAVNDAASITHAVVAASSADEYDAVSVAGVAVTVADDDTAGVSVSETTLTVAEGNSSTYTVVLDAQPASNVVIGVTRSGSSDVTVSPATLTFSPSNWDTAQTVTVSAAQDADAVNDAASITHAVVAASSADEFDNVSVAGVAVTVADDDTAGVSVSETTLTVAEGNSSTYTVVLDAQPASNVVIGVTRSGSSDVTVSPATLTFSPSNWDTAQTVTVSAAQDADAVNDAASITHAVDASRSADEYDAVSVAGVAVTVADDDAGVSVSETTLTVAEGNSSTYTVVLDAQPASDVVITVSSDNSDVTADTDAATSGNQATLTFSPSNWDTAQTVTVRAAQDADAVNDAASITHAVVAASSADEYDAVSVAGVAVTVADDDTAGVSVSETTLTVAEGNSSTYTVVLDAQPASDVVIGVTISGSPDVTVDRATLTFSPSNWDTAQTVTVRAAQDADAVNDAASITHAVDASRSADEYDNVSVAGVAVTVADDDAGVSVSETTLTVAEGNSSTYTVVLDAQPASDVVIGVTISGSPDVTVDRATLTFSPSNWDTAQTVTVRAAQDADAVNDAASITHAVDASRSADEYDAVSVAGVAVTVADDDAGVSVSETTLTVAEGNSSTYTVVLDAQPASNVVIGVTRSGSPDVTVDRATLTFSPSNWDTAQTVTVRAAQDADAVNDAASITHAVDASRSADEYDAVSVAGVAVTVADDDTAGVSVSETTLTVAEGNSSTYTVVLDAQPASNVVIGVTRSGSSDVTVSPATLTFSPSNWDTAQTVTVRAAQDADAVNDAASITHAVDASRSADEYDAVSVAGVAVTVADDDAGVSVSETTLTVAEGNSSTYTVVLDAQPASDVVITVSSDNSDVTADTDAATSGNQATLTFSPSNWDTAQTVTVRAAQDADAVNDAASITHAVDASRSADEYDAVSVAGVAVTVADDDTAGVSVSETTLTVAEGNSSTYTVVLDAQPASDVVIGVTASGSPDVTVDRATLTFSPSNWDTAQTVTVSAAQDADAVNDAASITHAVDASRSADEYDAVSVAGVAVTVADDDTAGVSVSETTLTVAEGNSSTYTVVLDAQPASDVVITVSSDNSDVTADTDAATSGNQATLTFSPSNWDTAQTVTVRAAQDADAVNDAASITHAVVAASSADEYDAVSVAGVAVTVADDDTAGVSVSETTLTVAEGNSSTYTVVLDAQPASDVVIGVTISGSPDVTVDRATLTFSPSNWDTAQTVTVRAAQDADAVNDAASITHAVDASRSADEYDAVSVAGVAVTVADDDAGVSVSETTLTVAEGNSSTYTVVLDAQPASDVVIGVTISGSPDVTVDRATLTFSPSNWDTAQTVTVRAAQDADAVNDAASITHAVDASRSADEYDAVSVAGVAGHGGRRRRRGERVRNHADGC